MKAIEQVRVWREDLVLIFACLLILVAFKVDDFLSCIKRKRKERSAPAGGK